MSKENPISWPERLRQGHKLARSSARNFVTHKTTGQKITAAAIASGAAIGGAKRGRREWKRKDKTKRLSRTASGAAKGAFGGAIRGAIVGHGVGRAVDYYTGQRRHESIDDLITYLLDNPDCKLRDELTDSKKFHMTKRLLDPRRIKGAIALGAVLGAGKSAADSAYGAAHSDKKVSKTTHAKNILKGAVAGGAHGYAAKVASSGFGLASRRLSRRWRSK